MEQTMFVSRILKVPPCKKREKQKRNLWKKSRSAVVLSCTEMLRNLAYVMTESSVIGTKCGKQNVSRLL